MAGTKEIKRRIKSVKSTKKVTKAMELVSASKMKRAINATLAARPYSSYSWEVLQSLSEYVSESKHPLLTEREGKTLIVLVTSNRGLCGGYNSQIIKRVMQKIRSSEKNSIDFISVGKMGEYALRRMGQNIIASFNDLSDTPDLAGVRPIVSLATDLFKNNEYARVEIAYTDFKSALTQIPTLHTLLPIKKEELIEELNEAKKTSDKQQTEYVFEPDYQSVMAMIVEKIAKARVFQMVLESRASEHSARMLAMKNASDAAGEMIDDLTLVFNKARQASITQEISEISAGMASVS